MLSRGELLELMVDSDERWRTLRCRLTAWRAPSDLPKVRIGGPRTGEVAYDVVATAQPFRLRLTRVSGAGPDDVVDDGEQTWVREGERLQQLPFTMGSQHTAEVRSALEPRRLVARGRLRVVGEQDGAVQVSVQGADGRGAGEVLVDAGTGLLLSQRWGTASSVVLTEVRYDEPVAPEVFAPLTEAHVQRGIAVPARYAPGLVVGLLLAAAGDGAVRLVQGALRRLPRW